MNSEDTQQSFDDVTLTERHLKIGSDTYVLSDIRAVEVKKDSRIVYWIAFAVISMSAVLISWAAVILGGIALFMGVLIESESVIITTTTGRNRITSYSAFITSKSQQAEAHRKATTLSEAIGRRL